MKPRVLLLVAVAACSPSRERVPEAAPDPVIRAAEPFAVLFERTLPGGEERAPLFGPGDSITVGPRQWTRDGVYAGRHAWGIEGQLRPIGVIGTTARPLILAIGWGGLEVAGGEGGDDHAWLVATGPHAEKPTYAVATAHEFLEDGFTISPHRVALVASEGTDIVVRALPAGVVIARVPHGAAKDDDAPVACWVDDAHVAWPGGGALHTLAITSGATTTIPFAFAGPLHCDSAGGAAATETSDGAVALVDLATGSTLAMAQKAPAPATTVTTTGPVQKAEPPPTDLDEAEPPAIAVGQRGSRLAVAVHDVLTVYAREGNKLVPLYTHALVVGAKPRMAFSPDGDRLAVATTALTVFGPAAQVHAGVAPRIAFELPRGFRSVPTRSADQIAWRWAQLGGPSGMAPQPALLVNAVEQENVFSDVTAIALARDEFTNLPAPDATDEQLTAFAKATMPQLFEQWENAVVEGTLTDELTLRVGRTKGLPWFETREDWRDGCEPYDGYTRVVVDRDAVFIIRALTVPGGSIDGWLAKFFDLPFGMRVQTARRHGPRSGPC